MSINVRFVLNSEHMESNIPQRTKQRFKRLLSAAVKEGLEQVEIAVKNNKYISPYHEWPEMIYSDNGLPSFSTSLFSGPKDYSNAFISYGLNDKAISKASLKSFNTFVNFCSSESEIAEKIFPKDRINLEYLETNYHEFVQSYASGFSAELIDRYIHINQTFDFDEKAFLQVYEPFSKTIFESRLSFDILIPILFLKSDIKQFQIGDGFSIEEMDEKIQLARFPLKAYGPGVHNTVLGCATHALVFKDYYVENSNRFDLSDIFNNVQSYPLKQINKFFAAVRIITGYDTGYAQVLVKARDWALRCKGDLPSLKGTSVRAYPNWFENFYWNNEAFPQIDEKQASLIADFFLKLLEANDNAIDIAIRRLNLCFIREEEEDVVLDATIGFEALLTDDERQEMTHKLALRIGALSIFFEPTKKTPVEVFKEIKKIYAYRSAIVHGSRSSTKRREIKLKNRKHVRVSSLAIEYLRLILKVIVENKEYRNTEKVDRLLLLGNGVNT